MSKVIWMCDRCKITGSFTGWPSSEEAVMSGWCCLRYEPGHLVGLRDRILCPHCASEFERFMENKSTGNESSPHVDSVSKVICPACQGEKIIDGVACPWCNGSGLKEGWNE